MDLPDNYDRLWLPMPPAISLNLDGFAGPSPAGIYFIEEN
jgi:hypothetical protein